MKFWEAMREMQENGKRVRCKRWNGPYESKFFWEIGSDMELPSGCDWQDVEDEWEIYETKSKPENCVLPSCNEITFASGTMPITIEQEQPIKIAVDYAYILKQLIRKCRRTKDGTITDEALINACMELSKEQG